MNLWIELIKFLLYAILIVLISKYILVRILRKIGELLKLKPKTVGNIAGIATSIPELLTASFSAVSGFILASTYNIISSNIINVVQYVIAVLFNKNHKGLKNRAIQIDLMLVTVTILLPIFMRIFHMEVQSILVPIFLILLYIFYRITNHAHRLYDISKKMTESERIEKDEGKEIEGIEKIDEKADTLKRKTTSLNIKVYSKREISSVVLQGILLGFVGIILYIIGNLLGAVLENLCLLFYVPEFVLGIVLGFITSLPELITFIESQRHHEKEHDGVVEATSNLLTSNIMNLFVIQSIAIILFQFS